VKGGKVKGRRRTREGGGSREEREEREERGRIGGREAGDPMMVPLY
jgi:hypothetical protein